MLDTLRWPELTLDVLTDIHLDPKNVRLETVDARIEADIMQDLFANEEVLNLVEGICKLGYLNHERPVVVNRDGKYVVVEGNRRIAALKAIQNPALVPTFQSRIAALATLLPNPKELSKVTVLVAPNQDKADQLIAAIHAGNLRRSWSPARQAAFFQAQVDSGRTLEELEKRYPLLSVKKFVFRASMINLFKEIDYRDPKLNDFLASPQWAKGLSTLSRIFEAKDFQKLIGLGMDKDGHITMDISESTFEQVAKVILQGMHDGSINTRTLNSVKSERFVQLMAELRSIVESEAGEDPGNGEGIGNKSRSGSIGSINGGSAHDSGTDASKQTGSKRNGKSGPPKKQRTLDLEHISVPQVYPKAMHLLVSELANIDVQEYPNTTFLLLRAVLERSIKAYAEVKNIDIRKTGNNEKGKVQLGHALEWLRHHVSVNGPRPLVQVIMSIQTGKLTMYQNTKEALNAVNHNHHFMVSPDEVISMWRSIDSVMRFLMKP